MPNHSPVRPSSAARKTLLSRGFIPTPGGLFSPPEGLFPLPARGTPGVLPVSCFTAVTLSLSLGANETGSSSWVSPRVQDLADCVA